MSIRKALDIMIYLRLKDPPSSLPKARSLWREYAGFRRPQEGAADTKMYCRHSGKSISAAGFQRGVDDGTLLILKMKKPDVDPALCGKIL